MKNKLERTQLAESAIELLRDGVNSESITKINLAFDIVNHETFNWIDLDVIFMEWQELCDKVDNLFNNNHES